MPDGSPRRASVNRKSKIEIRKSHGSLSALTYRPMPLPLERDSKRPAGKLLRILVADDHDIVCAGLQRMIAAQPGMEVCGMAANGTDAVEKAKRLKPDVAILDMNMGGLNGLECARELRKEPPECEVLLFTGVETDDLMRMAFVSGAKSFILKSDVRTHLPGRGAGKAGRRRSGARPLPGAGRQ